MAVGPAAPRCCAESKLQRECESSNDSSLISARLATDAVAASMHPSIAASCVTAPFGSSRAWTTNCACHSPVLRTRTIVRVCCPAGISQICHRGEEDAGELCECGSSVAAYLFVIPRALHKFVRVRVCSCVRVRASFAVFDTLFSTTGQRLL